MCTRSNTNPRCHYHMSVTDWHYRSHCVSTADMKTLSIWMHSSCICSFTQHKVPKHWPSFKSNNFLSKLRSMSGSHLWSHKGWPVIRVICSHCAFTLMPLSGISRYKQILQTHWDRNDSLDDGPPGAHVWSVIIHRIRQGQRQLSDYKAVLHRKEKKIQESCTSVE